MHYKYLMHYNHNHRTVYRVLHSVLCTTPFTVYHTVHRTLYHYSGQSIELTQLIKNTATTNKSY